MPYATGASGYFMVTANAQRQIGYYVVDEVVDPMRSIVDIYSQPLASEGNCQQCGHIGKIHYGPRTRWCNTNGCECQAFRA